MDPTSPGFSGTRRPDPITGLLYPSSLVSLRCVSAASQREPGPYRRQAGRIIVDRPADAPNFLGRLCHVTASTTQPLRPGPIWVRLMTR